MLDKSLKRTLWSLSSLFLQLHGIHIMWGLCVLVGAGGMPAPCPPTTSLSATSPRLWDTSRDGDPTTPWAAVPLSHHSLGEGIVPNSQPEPPLAQRQAMPSWPITGYPGEEAKSYLK